MPNTSFSVILVSLPIGVGCERERRFLEFEASMVGRENAKLESSKIICRVFCLVDGGRARTGSLDDILSRRRALSGRAALGRGMSRLLRTGGESS
jgi:hypothetical protein